MNWYLQSGKDSDVVLSTRIRFSRNINYMKKSKSSYMLLDLDYNFLNYQTWTNLQSKL